MGEPGGNGAYGGIGGDSITAGAPGTGGELSTAGAPGAGGEVSTGGDSSTGGDTGTGGEVSTGGDGGTGGSTDTGGSSSGGAGGAGGSSGCVPTNGGVERCDGVDNDCNDAIDDGIECVPDCTLDVTSLYLACADARDRVSAEYLCESQGMRLMRIDDATEQTYAETLADLLVSGQGWIWLGANDLAVSEDWAWQDGEVFYRGLAAGTSVNGLYSNFASTDPNHLYVEERCVALRAATGLWYDVRCYEAYPYLCEAY